MTKEKLRISKRTGIESGYANEWFMFCKNRIDNIERLFNDDTKKFYEYLKSRKVHFKKYAEKYPPDEYECVITEKNKRRVRFLDRVVDELNGMLDDYSEFDFNRFRTLTARAIYLIHGESFEAHEKRNTSDQMEVS